MAAPFPQHKSISPTAPGVYDYVNKDAEEHLMFDDDEDNILSEERGLRVVTNRISWRKRAIVTIITVLLVAFFLGVGFLVWPRQPTVALLSFDFDEQTPTAPGPDGELYTNWIGKLSVVSTNFLDIGVRAIDVQAYLASNQSLPVGTGRVSNVTIKRRRETVIPMAFKVPVFQPSSGKPSLLEQCMYAPTVNLVVNAQVDLSLTHWTGKRLHKSMKKTVDCKLPALYQLARAFE